MNKSLRRHEKNSEPNIDPLADFCERCQKPGESACSYAIALEVTLWAVKAKKRTKEVAVLSLTVMVSSHISS